MSNNTHNYGSRKLLQGRFSLTIKLLGFHNHLSLHRSRTPQKKQLFIILFCFLSSWHVSHPLNYAGKKHGLNTQTLKTVPLHPLRSLDGLLTRFIVRTSSFTSQILLKSNQSSSPFIPAPRVWNYHISLHHPAPTH